MIIRLILRPNTVLEYLLTDCRQTFASKGINTVKSIIFLVNYREKKRGAKHRVRFDAIILKHKL